MYFRFYFILSMALCFSVSGIWAQSLPDNYLDFGFALGGAVNGDYVYENQQWIDEGYSDQLLYLKCGYHRFVDTKISVGVDFFISDKYRCGYFNFSDNFEDNYRSWVFGLKSSYYFYRGNGAEIYTGFMAGMHNDTPLKYNLKKSELKELIFLKKTNFERSLSMKKAKFFASPHLGIRFFAVRYVGFYVEANYIPSYINSGLTIRF